MAAQPCRSCTGWEGGSSWGCSALKSTLPGPAQLEALQKHCCGQSPATWQADLGRGTQRCSKGNQEASPTLAERMGFDKHSFPAHPPSSLLKDCLPSHTTGMQPLKLSPGGLGAVGNNNTLGWKFPLDNEGTTVISSAAAPEAFPAPAILPSLCSGWEEARSPWVHFAELLGFHLSA